MAISFSHELEPRASSTPSTPSARTHSEHLHLRVRAFAQETLAKNGETTESFRTLARSILEFQRAESPGLARIWKEVPDQVEDLLGLPADAFRLGRVALHPEALDCARFRTSGTTQGEAGIHALRSLATYDTLALGLAKNTLFRDLPRAVVVALCPPPEGDPASSLNYMMRRFIDEFDGRSRGQSPIPKTAPELGSDAFLMSSLGPDVEALRRAARAAELRSEPFVILGAAFALAALLDALGGDTLQAGPEVRIMVTGGFKGRQVELTEADLRRELKRTFGAATTRIVGEYGMTELTSQLYEPWPEEDGAPARFLAPPWLRVVAVDPRTGQRVSPGNIGTARFIDLGNVDSVLVVQTEDLIIETPRGIELRGRRPKASSRGCSLPYETLLTGYARPS
jgi:hypothetical protein